LLFVGCWLLVVGCCLLFVVVVVVFVVVVVVVVVLVVLVVNPKKSKKKNTTKHSVTVARRQGWIGFGTTSCHGCWIAGWFVRSWWRLELADRVGDG